MITQEQVEVLRGMLSVRQPDVVEHQDPEIRQAFARQADALAAAIATIEGLPRTKDGVYCTPTDYVYKRVNGRVEKAMVGAKFYVHMPHDDGFQDGFTFVSDCYFTEAAAARGEVEGA